MTKKNTTRKRGRKNKGGNDPETGYEGDVSNLNDTSDDTSSDISPIPQGDEGQQINDDDLNFDNEDDSQDLMSLGPQPQDSTINTSNEASSLGQGLGAPPADGDGQANGLNMSISSTNNNNSNSLHLSDLNNSNVSSNATTLPTEGEGSVMQGSEDEGHMSEGGRKTRKRRRNKSNKSKKTKKSRKSRKNKKLKKSKKSKKSRK